MSAEAQKAVLIVALCAVAVYLGFTALRNNGPTWSQERVQEVCREGAGEWARTFGHASNGEIEAVGAALSTYHLVTCAGAWHAWANSRFTFTSQYAP